ncbi:hypothetical protein KSP40_PGU000584 [Platanthera guangdongensis]|uniref:Uncharacterized protein n=1 Tax=Platanthera guangdongensis TaxID=2320717 RepID=A0ABR2MEI2_9ASPA
MALLGCNVVSTDQVEVLPLLMKNIERNTSWIKQANPDSGLLNLIVDCRAVGFGSIEAAELYWGNEDHIKAVSPPFDYIIGTDILYLDAGLQLWYIPEDKFFNTDGLVYVVEIILSLMQLGYEIRSTTVHEQMIQTWKDNFVMKTVPKAKSIRRKDLMDRKYQHASIQLFIMNQKDSPKHGGKLQNTSSPLIDNGSDEECNKGETEIDVAVEELTAPVNTKTDDWEARRHGAIAARLLRNVKLA